MLAERNLPLILEIGEYTTETSNINYQSKAKEGVIVFWFRYRERGNKYTLLTVELSKDLLDERFLRLILFREFRIT